MITLRTYLSSGDVKMSALGLCWYYSCCNFLTISQTAHNGEGQRYGQKASHGPIMTDYFFPLHLSPFIRFCHTNRYYLFTHSAEAMNIGSCWKRHETRLDVGSYISHFKTSVSLWAFLYQFYHWYPDFSHLFGFIFPTWWTTEEGFVLNWQ